MTLLQDPSGLERVERLLSELTVEEKAMLTAGHDFWHLTRIPRAGIGALKMSDGPSGVRGGQMGTRRSLAFPCGMANGATWDPELIERLGGAIGDEARSKGVHVVLGPTVCIPRTPLGGRTFESYAEDPYLSARAAVAWIRGVQSRGVACCVKHFACNDQEYERMTISAEVDERTLREIHLPSFEAAVREAGVWAVMSAYNKVNGIYCGEHPQLLEGILKHEWGFDGVVISDWGGTHSTIDATVAGLDIEMPGRARFFGPPLADAVEAGDVPADVLDDHAARVLRLMQRTGLLDHAAPTDERDEDDDARRAIAHDVAIAGSVLLQNNGVLPFDAATLHRIAVIGPNAGLLEAGGGGSSGVYPHRYVAFADELRTRLPAAEIAYEPGCVTSAAVPAMDPRLIPHGLRVEYFGNAGFEGVPAGSDMLLQGQYIAMGKPVAGVPIAASSVRASGAFVPDVSGTWQIGVANAGLARVLIDGAVVVENVEDGRGGFFFGIGAGMVAQPVELVAGRAYELTVELRGHPVLPMAGFRLYAGRPQIAGAMERAVAAAQSADAAIVVVGSNSEAETEGKDRTGLHLIGEQDELVRRVLEANARTVVVINAGSPVAMPWADGAAAILMLWYPGEEGASALADMLTGAAEPSGRLPITFPRAIEDTPVHGAFYPGADGTVRYGEGVFVGYRHYDANGVEPLFAFGHGLSYTTFEVGEPAVASDGTAVRVSVPVTNAGSRRGSEVVQLYVGDVESPVRRPQKELKAFAKVTLDPGASTTVTLALDDRAFALWDEQAHGWRAETGVFDLHIGTSSRDIRHVMRLERAG